MKTGLSHWLDKFPGLRLTLWGDMVADEFLAGEIARVSREAPVLILKHRTRTLVPGGGANAAMNLAALGVRVAVVGVCGEDETGRELRRALKRAGVDTAALLALRGYITPTKTRILAHHAHTKPQQVVRMDREPAPLAPAIAGRLARNATRLARRSHALLLSDYGYGAVSPALAAGAVAALPAPRLACLDARFQISGYRGVTAATPNESEVEAALGITIAGDARALDAAGRRLRTRLGCQYLLITRGRDGMALFEPGRPTRWLEVHGGRQALDVTGAGDTVLAAFTAALAAGASGIEAAQIANVAGGLVVMKPGTAT
ncbi:MAG: bifunctional heptose 7-phosphate kinase/heptose 1-phosphate adenyltransferase, partial [Terriglobales bacterium]